MERWWDEWQKGVKRDQLSLMYVLWKEGLAVHPLGRHDARFGKRYLRYTAHCKPMRRPLGRVVRQLFNRADLAAFGIQSSPRWQHLRYGRTAAHRATFDIPCAT
jgi:hypothetical protein